MTTVPPNRQPLDPVRLQLSMYRHQGSTHLAVVGDLDQASAPTLTAAIEQVSRLPGEVVLLDLKGLTFCDCAGLGALLSAQHRLQADGRMLALHNPPRTVRRLFSITGLDRHLDSHPSTGRVSNDPHAAAPLQRAQRKRAPTRIATADPP